MLLSEIDLFGIKQIGVSITGNKKNPSSELEITIVDKASQTIVGTGKVTKVGNNMITITGTHKGIKDYELVVKPSESQENELMIDKLVFLR
jgi:hypothetical protein